MCSQLHLRALFAEKKKKNYASCLGWSNRYSTSFCYYLNALKIPIHVSIDVFFKSLLSESQAITTTFSGSLTLQQLSLSLVSFTAFEVKPCIREKWYGKDSSGLKHIHQFVELSFSNGGSFSAQIHVHAQHTCITLKKGDKYSQVLIQKPSRQHKVYPLFTNHQFYK